MKDMFCFQCQQTAHNKACEGKAGVCGKKPTPQIIRTSLWGRLSDLQERQNPAIRQLILTSL